MKKKFRRKKSLIEKQVQSAIALQFGKYWLISAFVLSMVWAGAPVLASLLFQPRSDAPWELGKAMFADAWPVFFTGIVLMPLLMWESVRFSNRFAGPVFRLRRSLRELAEGQSVTSIKLRKNDYWKDVAEEFNRAAAYVEQLKTSCGDLHPTEILDDVATLQTEVAAASQSHPTAGRRESALRPTCSD